eukprot:362871-Chlamydomonas_euryale.AAC.1
MCNLNVLLAVIARRVMHDANGRWVDAWCGCMNVQHERDTRSHGPACHGRCAHSDPTHEMCLESFVDLHAVAVPPDVVAAHVPFERERVAGGSPGGIRRPAVGRHGQTAAVDYGRYLRLQHAAADAGVLGQPGRRPSAHVPNRRAVPAARHVFERAFSSMPRGEPRLSAHVPNGGALPADRHPLATSAAS